MAASSEDASEKSLEPTQRKLEQARDKGEIARSSDLTTAAGYAGFLVATLLVGASSISDLGALLASFLERPDRLVPLVFDVSGTAPLDGLASSFVLGLAPWVLVPAIFSIGIIFFQNGFVFTPSRLAPKLSRVSPFANAAQKLGRSGLFEFAKSLLKLSIYAGALWFLLQSNLEEMARTIWTEPKIAMLILSDLLVAFMIVVVLVAIVIGLLDLIWQRQDHIRKNRMSFQEMRDEAKELEGDPHLKQARRQRAHEIANNRMMLDVPKADVVIVNPTHYAVALHWSRKRGEAPVCVAKGADAIAARIRELAAEHGVPLHSDPATARALFAMTDIGSEIAPEHYKAVAAAVRFAETIRRKAGKTK
jgi:flagellar biosynthetic protein FlhB